MPRPIQILTQSADQSSSGRAQRRRRQSMLQDFLLTLDAGTRKAVLREMRKDLVDLNLMTAAEWRWLHRKS